MVRSRPGRRISSPIRASGVQWRSFWNASAEPRRRNGVARRPYALPAEGLSRDRSGKDFTRKSGREAPGGRASRRFVEPSAGLALGFGDLVAAHFAGTVGAAFLAVDIATDRPLISPFSEPLCGR